MNHKGTWVALFFIASALIIAAVLDVALTDIFAMLRIPDEPILGDRFTSSTLTAYVLAILLGVAFGVLYQRTRTLVEQCIVELEKVHFPTWLETRRSTGIVVVMSFISAAILGVFDFSSNWLTTRLFEISL